MKNRFAIVFAAAICLLAASSLPVLAHHGNASFDAGKKLTLKATVTKWFWANPHCFLEFDVKYDAGNTVHWVAETEQSARHDQSRMEPQLVQAWGSSHRHLGTGEERLATRACA